MLGLATEATTASTKEQATLDNSSPAERKSRGRSTEETACDARSNLSVSSDGQYEVIEYDVPDVDDADNELANDSSVFFSDLQIAADSPAAEALRANANVHVSSVGKAARAVHMQSVRRVIKRATTVRPKKGKPPRVPPPLNSGLGEADDTDSLVLEELPELSEDESATSEPENNFEEVPCTPKEQIAPQRLPLDHMPDGVAPGTVEAGKKVLGSVDPHDLLKLVRWRRKKKGTVKKKKSYVKGKVIDGEHELYTLSIAVMIGVRMSISRTNTELNSGPNRRWVRPADFYTTEKYEFRPKGAGTLPPHQLAHTFKFKDYSPLAFAYLRRMYGVNEFDFLLSVCGNANFIEFISNAKSGQFFFYSSDGRYMIKTMTNAESKFLRRILPQYFKHCCENPNTMITRFFGMYRVKLYHLRRNVKFVIMNSVYCTDKILQSFYDLKGSSVGRDAKPGQAVLKDNDLRRSLPEAALAMRPSERDKIRSQLESDCKVLSDMNVMDYSMLVGVHHIPAFEGKSSDRVLSFRKTRSGNRTRRNTGSSQGGDESVASEAESVTKRDVEAPGSPMKSMRGSLSRGHNRSLSDTLRADTLGVYSFEDGLEDDENSYLVGSDKRTAPKLTANEETEKKKLATIEKLFWPFHHLFDIHGHRRLTPACCSTCGDEPCECVDKDSKLLEGYNIPTFIPPLSDRKDKGLEMDTTGLQLPRKFKGPGGEMLYEGKIFYMGIIDVLQEYNTRKSLEAKYRIMQSPMLSASCVPPQDYGKRFIKFFDQFTKKVIGEDDDEIGIEVSVRA